MAGVDDDRTAAIEVRAVTDGSTPGDSAPDRIEMGSSRATWPWRKGGFGLVCVALVAGLVVGYLVGTQRTDKTTSAPPPTAIASTPRLSVSAAMQPPTPTGNRCSVQLGDKLQLGVEVVNLSTVGTTLLRTDVSLPLGGLRATATAWGSCGQLSAVDGGETYPLPSGATTWLRMTFDVLVPCPGPMPVLFSVRYEQTGNVAVSDVGGFVDLGDVPYTGCSASPG